MKLQRNIAIILAAAFVLLPALAGAAAAADSSTESLQRVVLFQSPGMSNHYGYITVGSFGVGLNRGNAIYTGNFSI